MADSTRRTVIAYVALSLTTILVLVILLINCNKKQKDNYCICAGGAARNRICQNDMTKAYDSGLNETANLSALQQRAGGPKWTTISPGDYDFPYSQDCNEVNAYLTQLV